MDTVNSIAGSS